MKEIKMVLPADFNFVPGIRACLAHFAYNFGFNDKEAYHIQTIVDEICNNAIEHGSKGKDAKIFITCRFKKSEIELLVKDNDGLRFNVKDVFRRNLELLETDPYRRGKGLIIVQRLVNKLDIRVGKNGTTVKIIKKAGDNGK